MKNYFDIKRFPMLSYHIIKKYRLINPSYFKIYLSKNYAIFFDVKTLHQYIKKVD